jgi:hypothetical protein
MQSHGYPKHRDIRTKHVTVKLVCSHVPVHEDFSPSDIAVSKPFLLEDTPSLIRLYICLVAYTFVQTASKLVLSITDCPVIAFTIFLIAVVKAWKR